MLSLENAAGEIRFMPWAKIKVTDSPADLYDAAIAIDPATLNVDDLTSGDSLGAVKSKLQAVIDFLRSMKVLALVLVPLGALADVAPLYTTPNEMPGDAPLMTNTEAYVAAKIVELVHTPGNYAIVSNRAMSAIQEHQTLEPSTNYTDSAIGIFASTGAVSRAATYGTPTRWTDATGCVWEVSYGWLVYTNGALAVGWTAWNYQIDAGPNGGYYGLMIGPNEDLDSWTYPVASGLFPSAPQWNAEYESVYDTDYEYRGIVQGDTIRAVRGGTNLVGRVALTNDISQAISTSNAAFVSAVLAAPLVGADPDDLSELSEYGSYGTVGAALLALIAGLAALKRRMATKQDMYPMIPATPTGGTLTVAPYTAATYTADETAAAFTVAVGTGTAGMARDCELVIDCTGSGAVAPTVTWPSNFHPRTDAGTDFACETGTRNVYYISEYSTGAFAVGGWQETAGGNA